MRNIFSEQEVLISCSSLQGLKLEEASFYGQKESLAISKSELLKLIDRIKIDIEAAAKKTADMISRRQIGGTADINRIITEILLSRRYRGGRRELRNPKLLYRKIRIFTKSNRPIQLTISLFPCKIPNALKTEGPLPDLADLISLARLVEISKSVKNVYQPGLKIIVLMDGNRFRKLMNFPQVIINIYQKHIYTFLKIINGEAHVYLEDYENLIARKLGNSYLRKKEATKSRIYKEYVSIFRSKVDASNLNNHIKYLEKLTKNKVLIKKFLALYKSLIYSVYDQEIETADQMQKDRTTIELFKEIFNIHTKNRELNDRRKKILEKTWVCTLNYISEIHTGRLLKPVEKIYPDSIRCDMHNITDRLTLYPVNRSTKLTSFHGMGYIDAKKRMHVGLRILLKNKDYLPVYGNLHGIDYYKQPFFYIHKLALNSDKSFSISDFHLR